MVKKKTTLCGFIQIHINYFSFKSRFLIFNFKGTLPVLRSIIINYLPASYVIFSYIFGICELHLYVCAADDEKSHHTWRNRRQCDGITSSNWFPMKRKVTKFLFAMLKRTLINCRIKIIISTQLIKTGSNDCKIE